MTHFIINLLIISPIASVLLAIMITDYPFNRKGQKQTMIEKLNWMGLIFLLILAYLILNSGGAFSSSVSALGTQATSIISTLQGNSTGTGVKTPKVSQA